MKKKLLSVTIIVVMESNNNEHCLSITTIISVMEWAQSMQVGTTHDFNVSPYSPSPYINFNGLI